jgi:predicted esterase
MSHRARSQPTAASTEVAASETAGFWSGATEAEAVVAVPESSQLDSDGNPCWDDHKRAARDVDAATEEAFSFAPRDAPLILGGASQGARVAMRRALDGTPPQCRGFIAVVGAADRDAIPSTTETIDSRLKGVMIGGAEDRLVLHHQRAMQKELMRVGLQVRLEEVPGLTHWYPPDFPSRLRDAIEFVLSA